MKKNIIQFEKKQKHFVNYGIIVLYVLKDVDVNIFKSIT